MNWAESQVHLDGVGFDWSKGELAEGLRCYREREFFNAHEYWEKVWLVSSEPEKSLIQAVIQIAAACHHLQNGNVCGTISLLKSAIARISRHPPVCAGIAVTALREDAVEFLSRLEGVSKSECASPPYPAIRLHM